jgi:fructan beta-fructosidase
VGRGAPAGGSGVQYFVGQFDGATFVNENAPHLASWLDLGADAYAAQSWSDVSDGRRLAIAWMSNWVYARTIPTTGWRGAMTLPRELSLVRSAAGVRLRQAPAREMQTLRSQTTRWQEIYLGDGQSFAPTVDEGSLWEVVADFSLAGAAPDRLGLRLLFGDQASVTVTYAAKERMLSVDRTTSGDVGFDPTFPAVHQVHLEPHDDLVRLHLFLDRSSLELFANDGDVVMTELLFPPEGPVRFEFFADGGPVALTQLDLYRLTPARMRVGAA